MRPTHKPLAIVVEDNDLLRDLVAVLLEESEMEVIACDSAEAALAALDRYGSRVNMIFTDVNLAGLLTGVELAAIAKRRFPDLCVLVTSGKQAPPLPEGTRFLAKPWMPLDVLREAERVHTVR